jgi:hypothetical protein
MFLKGLEKGNGTIMDLILINIRKKICKNVLYEKAKKLFCSDFFYLNNNKND